MVLCASRAFFFSALRSGLSKGRVSVVKRHHLCCVQTLWNVKVHQRGQTWGEREGWRGTCDNILRKETERNIWRRGFCGNLVKKGTGADITVGCQI